MSYARTSRRLHQSSCPATGTSGKLQESSCRMTETSRRLHQSPHPATETRWKLQQSPYTVTRTSRRLHESACRITETSGKLHQSRRPVTGTSRRLQESAPPASDLENIFVVLGRKPAFPPPRRPDFPPSPTSSHQFLTFNFQLLTSLPKAEGFGVIGKRRRLDQDNREEERKSFHKSSIIDLELRLIATIQGLAACRTPQCVRG